MGAGDASLIVTSLNLEQRHMDESQRTLAVPKLANLDAGRPPASDAAKPAAEADETAGSGQGRLARLAKLRQLAARPARRRLWAAAVKRIKQEEARGTSRSRRDEHAPGTQSAGCADR